MKKAEKLFLKYEKLYDNNVDILRKQISAIMKIEEDKIFKIEKYQREYDYAFHGYLFSIRNEKGNVMYPADMKHILLKELIPYKKLLDISILDGIITSYEAAEKKYGIFGEEYRNYAQSFVYDINEDYKDFLDKKEEIKLWFKLRGYSLEK